MKKYDLTDAVKPFARRLKNTWQAVFLPSVIIYGLSLLHLFYQRPAPNDAMAPYLRNIDLVSYIVAIILAVIIFRLKRTYFSRRFCRDVVEDSLMQNPDLDDESLLKKVFKILQKKMLLVWILGFLIVLDGVIFYWLTFSSQNNMHIYFIIGLFSLFINYPRDDLFSNLPWYVREGRKEFKPQQDLTE